MTMRPVAPIELSKKATRNPIAPPPKIAWLALPQLVIDEEYQRGLSIRSLRLIETMVSSWDWNHFKPLSVAPRDDGTYEIVDGQHTAIAAATHGSIENLPCLVLSAETQAGRASAFVAINTNRLTLTPFALYRARVSAGEPEAVAVFEAIEAQGVTLIEAARSGDPGEHEYAVGTCASVGSLLQIVRKGGKARLKRVFKIAMDGEVQMMRAGMLKALAEIVTDRATAPADVALSTAIARAGADILYERAAERGRMGTAPGNTAIGAWVAVILEEVARNRRDAA